jgi:hypothetical protein
MSNILAIVGGKNYLAATILSCHHCEAQTRFARNDARHVYPLFMGLNIRKGATIAPFYRQ